ELLGRGRSEKQGVGARILNLQADFLSLQQVGGGWYRVIDNHIGPWRTGHYRDQSKRSYKINAHLPNRAGIHGRASLRLDVLSAFYYLFYRPVVKRSGCLD